MVHNMSLAGPNGPGITWRHLQGLGHPPQAGCSLTPIINANKHSFLFSQAVPLKKLDDEVPKKRQSPNMIIFWGIFSDFTKHIYSSASIQYDTFQLYRKQGVGDFHDIFHILYAFHLTKMGHLQYPPLQLDGGSKYQPHLTGMGVLSAIHTTKMGHIEGAPFQLNGRCKICEIYHENHLHLAFHSTKMWHIEWGH